MWKTHTHIQDNQLKPPIVAKNPCRHHADGVFEFLGSFYLIIHDEFIKKVLYLSIENTIILRFRFIFIRCIFRFIFRCINWILWFIFIFIFRYLFRCIRYYFIWCHAWIIIWWITWHNMMYYFIHLLWCIYLYVYIYY